MAGDTCVWFTKHNVQRGLMERNGLLVTEFVTRFDPARVLAECDAKRRIVAEHESYCRTASAADDAGDPGFYDVAGVYSGALWHLALVFADHPDFDPDWRP